MLGEPGDVVVDADVAEVDGRHLVAGHEGRRAAGRRRRTLASTCTARTPRRPTARDSSVLSMPNITSPSGLPAVSSALLTIVPASPPTRASTSMPVRAVNPSSASFELVPVGRERVVDDQRHGLPVAARSRRRVARVRRARVRRAGVRRRGVRRRRVRRCGAGARGIGVGPSELHAPSSASGMARAATAATDDGPGGSRPHPGGVAGRGITTVSTPCPSCAPRRCRAPTRC